MVRLLKRAENNYCAEMFCVVPWPGDSDNSLNLSVTVNMFGV